MGHGADSAAIHSQLAPPPRIIGRVKITFRQGVFVMSRSRLFALFVVALCFSGVIGLRSASAADPKPIRALLVLGGCCHDYREQQQILTKGISARANVQWTISYDP